MADDWCVLLEEDGRYLEFPASKVSEFCRMRSPQVHDRNLQELLGLTPKAASRLHLESHVVEGLRLLDSMAWLRRVNGDGIVYIMKWNVEQFVADVANSRRDMSGLRSPKNVKSFVCRHKIKGTVRTVYGETKDCPGGWELIDRPREWKKFLTPGRLPWKVCLSTQVVAPMAAASGMSLGQQVQ